MTKDNLLEIIVGYTILSLIVLVLGGCEALWDDKCEKVFNRRIQYVLPSYAFGCWIMEDMSKKDPIEGTE